MARKFDMPSFLEQVGNSARDFVETIACGVENYQDFIRRISPLGDNTPVPPSLWPLLCPDRPPPPELFPQPPFEGGQCEGIGYRVEGTNTIGTPTTSNWVRTTVGPIRGVRVDDLAAQWNIFLLSGENVESLITTINKFPGAEAPTAEITLIERLDGLPDDCGSPPPAIPLPPSPLPPGPPEDRPVTDPDGGPDIDFTFAPRVGPIFIGIDGGLYVPVTVNVSGPNIFAPIDIPVNISLPDFSPTFNIGGGAGGGGGGGEPGPPEVPCCEPPERPGPTEEGEEDEPVEVEPDEEGGRLFGVRVASVVNASRAAATRVGLSENSPELWVPRIATVVFELKSEDSDGNAITSTSSDFNVKTTNQLVLAPDGVTVSRVFVTPSKGVRSSATPIYKRTP